MSLTPEFLSSRAALSTRLPDRVPDSYVTDTIETLVFFFGEQMVLDKLNILHELLDKDNTFTLSESSLAYVGVFDDAPTAYVNDVMMKEFTVEAKEFGQSTDLKFLFKRKPRVMQSIDPNYKINDYRRNISGNSEYLVSALDGADPLWVLAPAMAPGTAIEQYKSIRELEEETLYEKYVELMERGYTIPEEVIPTVTVPENVQFKPVSDAFKVSLVGSRWIRDFYPHSSRGMTSIDGSNAGTYWKFRKIAQEISITAEAEGEEVRRILLLGSGRCGTTGMCAAVSKFFRGADVTVFDPVAIEQTFPSEWTVNCAPFDPEVTMPDVEFDLVFSDVAVGDGAQFDEDFTDNFGRKIITRFKGKSYIVIKSDVGKMCSRLCTKIYFGRGHNAEMFVRVDKKDKGRLVSCADATKVIKDKRDCDMARNMTHIEGIYVKRNTPITLLEPVPARCGGKLGKPWSHHRKYRTGLSTSDYARVLAGFDTRSMAEDSPVKHLVDVIRMIAFMVPDACFDSLVPGSRDLFTRIRSKFDGMTVNHKKMRDKLSRGNKSKGQRKAESAKRGARRAEFLKMDTHARLDDHIAAAGKPNREARRFIRQGEILEKGYKKNL